MSFPPSDGQRKYLTHLCHRNPELADQIFGPFLASNMEYEDIRTALDTLAMPSKLYSVAIDGIKQKIPVSEAARTVRAGLRDQQDDQQNEQEDQQILPAQIHRTSSTRGFIEKHLRNNNVNPALTKRELLPQVGDPYYEDGTLVFKRNPTADEKAIGITTRQPLPVHDGEPNQHQRFRMVVDEVAAQLLGKSVEEVQRDQDEGKLPEPKPEPKREPEPKRSALREKVDAWLKFVREVRTLAASRAADGHPLDEIGLRPVEYGTKMLAEGIPIAACKDAMTMHYPAEIRRTLRVTEYDVTGFNSGERRDGVHAALPYCLAVVKAGVPLALTGPKGTGKTTLARHIAEALSVPFGFVSMTSGTSPSAFNGRPRIGSDGTDSLVKALIAKDRLDDALLMAEDKHREGDVATSLWSKLYGGGGVYLMDEMDAADENLLLLVNAALANGHFANSATGQIVSKHEDFIPVCGMNTLGLGAGRDYTSRNKLDAATLDRWNMGRVRIHLDERIEHHIIESILAGAEG